MIVTDHFVYVHVSRSGGTFLNKLILKNIPGARMLQYHGHLRDLPEQYTTLPVIGFVRNPWDWYVSMYFDYRRKTQFVYQILSDRNRLGFEATISRFLKLGDDSETSRSLLKALAQSAPHRIQKSQPPRHHLPGLKAEHFLNFGKCSGYYSWLFRLMFETDASHRILIGRFENLRAEALRLLEETGTPITNGITEYLETARPLNAAPRPTGYMGRYSPDLAHLVAKKDHYIIDRFSYRFEDLGSRP